MNLLRQSFAALVALWRRLTIGRLERLLTTQTQQIKDFTMATIEEFKAALAAQITQLQTDVSSQTSAVEGMKTAWTTANQRYTDEIAQLQAQLAAQAPNLDLSVLDPLKALNAGFEANTQGIADAVAANTPAAPTAPAPTAPISPTTDPSAPTTPAAPAADPMAPTSTPTDPSSTPSN